MSSHLPLDWSVTMGLAAYLNEGAAADRAVLSLAERYRRRAKSPRVRGTLKRILDCPEPGELVRLSSAILIDTGKIAGQADANP